MSKKKKYEYRMVAVRPAGQVGRKEFHHSKRDVEHLLKGMADHIAHQQKLAELLPRYGVWEVYAEYREAVPWVRWGE
jgi:transposase